MPTSELYIGLMSGTSLDGIDAALVDLSATQPRLIATRYLAYPRELRYELLALHQPTANELHLAQIAGNRLARLYAEVVNNLLGESEINHSNVTAIGCHGQTIRHCPEQEYTLQIGNASLLAELTGIAVVNDFRSRDIAAGGQGAPLVPAFHERILRDSKFYRVIVNIGGISNLTALPPSAPTAGFDCGPGNLLMDSWCAQHTGRPYDNNGTWAASGKVIPKLLEALLADSFFSLPPPKSTGRDLFNMNWLLEKLDGKEKAEDVQATLLELSCRGIADSINHFCSDASDVYLCGGGAHNQILFNRLVVLLNQCKIHTTSALGMDIDYLEAIAFAWLARQTIQGQAANLPVVTGAKHSCVLGSIHHA